MENQTNYLQTMNYLVTYSIKSYYLGTFLDTLLNEGPFISNIYK